MPLDGAHAKELTSLLCSAFSQHDLEQLLYFTLNRKLFDLVPPGQRLSDMIFQLLLSLEREGITGPFLEAVKDKRALRSELVAACDRALAKLAGPAPDIKEVPKRKGPPNSVPAAVPAPSIEEETWAVLSQLMRDRDERAARLGRAFVKSPGLLARIDCDGQTGVFLSRLLQTLLEYGQVEQGVPALAALLQSIREEVGVDGQARIDSLVSRLREGG